MAFILLTDPDHLTDTEEIVIDVSGMPTSGSIQLVKLDSTETTINVVASAGTFTRLTGSFTTDGYLPGHTIVTTGFTNPGNNATKIIDTITGSGTIIKVTVTTGLVDESGGGDERIRGRLTDLGVSIKCVYSKLKELWRSSAVYIKFPFPMIPITDEQFELVNGWNWKDDTTRYLLRTGGWAVKDPLGVSTEEWAGIISLGSLGDTDQVYFQQVAAGSPVNIQLTGPVNQAIKVYEDGGDDFRAYLKLFCREWKKSYAFSQLSDIGVSALTYQAYRFPLANSVDVKITTTLTENFVDITAPYTGMSITWLASPQTETGFTTGSADFHIVIDGNAGTAQQIYEFVQRQLRKSTDINADTPPIQIGKVTGSILKFVGDTLYTYELPEGGTFIEDFLSADRNSIVFVDDAGTERIYPYVSVLVINFGDNLKSDADAKYWVYFTTTPSGGNYGETDAILVNDGEAVPSQMTGTIGGVSSISRTFDYDGNIQGDRVIAPPTDVDITAVAIGLETGQFVKATGTIAKSKANSISLVAPLERNYSNPA